MPATGHKQDLEIKVAADSRNRAGGLRANSLHQSRKGGPAVEAVTMMSC